MAYKPIESYGVIGDLHTVALVGMDGSIDWCCLPHFDSPSIFAAILDEHKGGFFKIASLYEAQHKQMYLPDSNVLVTRFLSPEGVGEVVDFMPVQDPSHSKKTHQIVRVVRAVRFRLECQPAFDYARRPHQVTLEGRGAVFEAPGMRFSLVSRFPLARQRTGVATEFLLHPGEPSTRPSPSSAFPRGSNATCSRARPCTSRSMRMQLTCSSSGRQAAASPLRSIRCRRSSSLVARARMEAWSRRRWRRQARLTFSCARLGPSRNA
jgi:hypothetical protein